MNEVIYDPELCHDFSRDNEESVKKSKKVGCFACLVVVDASEIKIYSSTKSAICNNCHNDTIIPDHDTSSARDFSFLHLMYKKWFSGSRSRPKGKIYYEENSRNDKKNTSITFDEIIENRNAQQRRQGYRNDWMEAEFGINR